MSECRWVGLAPSAAQVSSVTVTAYSATTLYSINLGLYTVSILGTGGTTATTAAALVAALQLTTTPIIFQTITWSVLGSTITGTAINAGVPFTFTATVAGSSGTFGAVSTSVPSSGPNDWSTAANWSTGAVPVTGDDVFIDNTADFITYGLGQSAVTLLSLNVALSFTGQLGLPKINTSQATPYSEYLPDYLAIGATTQNIGYDQGNGSQLIKINNGSVATTLNLMGSGQSALTGLEPVLWKGTGTTTINAIGGQLGVAVYGGETATLATLNVTGATVRCSSGVTLTTVNNSGGTIEINSAATLVHQTSGSITIFGTGDVTTLSISGGTVSYQSSGTVTTANIRSGAVVDCSVNLSARTFTTANLYAGGALLDPFGTLNFASGGGALNIIDDLGSSTFVGGKNSTLQVTCCLWWKQRWRSRKQPGRGSMPRPVFKGWRVSQRRNAVLTLAPGSRPARSHIRR
jgi:hypothetical protein